MDPVPINPLVQQAFNAQSRAGGGYPSYRPQMGQYMRPLSGAGYSAPQQYPIGNYPTGAAQLPPQFRPMMLGGGARSSGSGFSGGNRSVSPQAMAAQQQPPQGQFPFQLPNFMGLGDFYTPHGMGDAQNVTNSGPMANFLGNQWQSNQWGQTPGNQFAPSQYMPPLHGRPFNSGY